MTEKNVVNISEQGEILQAFFRTLTQETHVLNQNPDLLWQQMYNRLQWSEIPIKFKDDLRLRTEFDLKPWIHTKTPTKESTSITQTLAGHDSTVLSCCYSKDGNRIVSGSGDGKLRIWDGKTGALLFTLKGHNDKVNACSFSHDNHLLVSGSEDGNLKIWNTETWYAIRTSGEHKAPISDCSFSPNDQWIITSGGLNDFQRNIKRHEIKIWDVETGRIFHTLTGHTGRVYSCAFSPDGKKIVSGSHDGTLRIWCSKTGKELTTINGHESRVNSCGFSPDGKMVFSCGYDKTIKIWNVETYKEVSTLRADDVDFDHCAISPDGFRVVSWFSFGNELQVWRIETEEIDFFLRGHASYVIDCDFSPTGHSIVTGSFDETLKVWDLDYETHKSYTGHSSEVFTCDFSPDGASVVTGSNGGDDNLIIWNAESGIKKIDFSGFNENINTCSFHPDGKQFVTGSFEKLSFWKTEPAECVRSFEGHDGEIHKCVYSPDGQYVLSGSDDKTLKIWNARKGILKSKSIQDDFIYDCGYSPNGDCFVAGGTFYREGSGYSIKVFDSKRVKEIATFAGHKSDINSCAYSPDGLKIVTGSGSPLKITKDFSIKIWESNTGQLIKEILGHTDVVRSCLFSPDGKYIISVGDDKSLRVWKADSGEELMFISLMGGITCLALHPWKAEAVCTDYLGNVYFLVFFSITYESIIVTAKLERNYFSKKLVVCCPACGKELMLLDSQLGQKTTCTSSDCGLCMKLNPFVINMK